MAQPPVIHHGTVRLDRSERTACTGSKPAGASVCMKTASKAVAAKPSSSEASQAPGLAQRAGGRCGQVFVRHLAPPPFAPACPVPTLTTDTEPTSGFGAHPLDHG